MLDWLRLLSMVFYAPTRGMREVRDRAGLAPTGFVALIVHWVFLLSLAWSYLRNIINFHSPFTLLLVLFNSAGALLFIALVFVPLAIFLVNLLERRASFRLVMQQEYSAVASTLFYGWAGASLIAL